MQRLEGLLLINQLVHQSAPSSVLYSVLKLNKIDRSQSMIRSTDITSPRVFFHPPLRSFGISKRRAFKAKASAKGPRCEEKGRREKGKREKGEKGESEREEGRKGRREKGRKGFGDSGHWWHRANITMIILILSNKSCSNQLNQLNQAEKSKRDGSIP